MASKKLCDFCKKEILSGSDDFTIDIFGSKDTTVVEKDCCRKCLTRVKKALAFLVKK